MLRRTNPVPLETSPQQKAQSPAGKFLALALLFLTAAVFLFVNLGEKYLWQDEAATAVLGSRLMKFGEPLAYDGVNLITMDYSTPEELGTLDQRTADAESSVQYHVARGDFKRNTAWIGQPWGSFAVVGASLTCFGQNTVAARAPFAAAGLLTVILLYWFVRREFKDPLLAWLSAALLVTNVYWVVHTRQCRYYAVSSLLLLLTLIAYARWQRGQPWGGAVFVATAWCWFQMDFGSFWPVIGVLLALAAWGDWPRVRRVLVAGAALGAAIAPWVWYYELAGRVKASLAPFSHKFTLNLLHLNQFLIPLVLLAALGIVLAVRGRRLDPVPRRVLAACLAILLAVIVWVPSVAPWGFHRYIVHLAPLAALGAAWVLTEAAGWVARRYSRERSRTWVAAALAAFLAVCPLLPNLVTIPLVTAFGGNYPTGLFVRAEWAVLHEEVFAPRPDPNRLTVESLALVASPGDEVLTNYEDVPLMFYTDYRVRGGIPMFRVEDRSRPPRFLVLRRSTALGVGPPLGRELARHRWQPLRTTIPDMEWGNMPEPEHRIGAIGVVPPPVIFAENLGPAQPGLVPKRPNPVAPDRPPPDLGGE
jgi:hypothetical protein